MDRFKSIIIKMQGKNKSNLHWLYNTATDQEPPKIFTYRSLHFWFSGTGCRSSEKLILYVEIPVSQVEGLCENNSIPIESYLLSVLSPIIRRLGEKYLNLNKNIREKAQFSAQAASSVMLRRNGLIYDHSKGVAILTIHFSVPLVNTLSVNAKAAVRAVKDILDHISTAMEGLDREELNRYFVTYKNQQKIRQYMKKNGLCAFIANGSILPRENDGMPKLNAIPFVSPREKEVNIPLGDGVFIIGMGISNGITVITGGGYSGKSTLLEAIEAGIYNHIPGDGREYVLTDDSALKIYAEDGRPVYDLDLSPFFRYLPGDAEVSHFYTPHASGSVSQAANIIEAVCGGSKLLLIDEDRCATNFMIRDWNMRKVVKNEPIIPFTDRVRELYQDKSVSTILVIGGTSEYFSCADCVILMDNYVAKDITEEIQLLDLPMYAQEPSLAVWRDSRRLVPRKTGKPFLYLRSVETENEKKIILDDCSVDITFLTAIVSSEQVNTLACVMELILTDKNADDLELIGKVEEMIQKICGRNGFQSIPLQYDSVWHWYEEIRPLDAYCCVNRMRGLFLV